MVSITAATAAVRIQNVATLLQLATEADTPLWRAQYLADAQRLAGWALRSVVDQCRDDWVSWRTLAHGLDIGHDTLYRQHAAGGPVVVASPYRQARTPEDDRPTPLVVAFRSADDGVLHGGTERDIRALMSFDIVLDANAPGPYRARRIVCYYRHPVTDVPVAELGRAAGFTLREPRERFAVCVTESVFDELFGLA